MPVMSKFGTRQCSFKAAAQAAISMAWVLGWLGQLLQRAYKGRSAARQFDVFSCQRSCCVGGHGLDQVARAGLFSKKVIATDVGSLAAQLSGEDTRISNVAELEDGIRQVVC